MPIGVYPRPSLRSRFEAKIDRNGPVMPGMTTPCHLWTGNRSDRGYGQVKVNGRTRRATHIALGLAGRPLPTGLVACHRCDNPPCVREDHLFHGTSTENVRDSVSKGRHATGEKNGVGGKLSREDVDRIRELGATGKHHREIGAKFGVSHCLVGKILRRELWANG